MFLLGLTWTYLDLAEKSPVALAQTPSMTAGIADTRTPAPHVQKHTQEKASTDETLTRPGKHILKRAIAFARINSRQPSAQSEPRTQRGRRRITQYASSLPKQTKENER